MQPNDFTLAVDLANTGVTTDVTFTRVEEHLNRSGYIVQASHEPGMRDVLGFYRAPAKPTSTFKGVQKCAFKFTIDQTVDAPDGTTVDAPLIGEVSFSVPVGVTTAEQMILRQRILALLDQDSIMDSLMNLNII